MTASNAAQSPVAIGSLIAGKYQVERVLGAGAMGVVVAARHLDLHELRAIKLMLPAALGNAEGVERFLREARAAARLKSQHVARVHDVGRLETGAPFAVIEYLEGSDLKAILDQRGTLPPAEAALYVLQACEAVGEAHAAGIVHRDLKPANLFLTRGPSGEPCVKVLDFGIAKVASPNEDVQMTATSALLGTPLYMSPEQMRGARDVDARSDIWALGVILYRMSTGRTPFTGTSVTEICAAVVADTPPPPRSLRPDLPPAFEAIILRCLQKSPADRMASVPELVAALAPFAPSAGRISQAGAWAPPSAQQTFSQQQPPAAAQQTFSQQQPPAAAQQTFSQQQPPAAAQQTFSQQQPPAAAQQTFSQHQPPPAAQQTFSQHQPPPAAQQTFSQPYASGQPYPGAAPASQQHYAYSSAQPPSANGWSPASMPGSSPHFDGVQRPPTAPRSSAAPLVIAGIAGALILGGAAAYFVTRSDDSPARAGAPAAITAPPSTPQATSTAGAASPARPGSPAKGAAVAQPGAAQPGTTQPVSSPAPTASAAAAASPSAAGDLATGTACGAASQCKSGFCVDGFCCDSACNSTCMACSAAKKHAAGNGICGFVSGGEDPDHECGSGKRCNGMASCVSLTPAQIKNLTGHD